MALRRVAFFVLLCWLLGWTQDLTEAADGISIDLGWLVAVQQNRGWRITEAPPAPSISKTKRRLKVGDLLLSIDGHDLALLGPLAVARMLDDVPFRAVPMHLVRNGKTYDVLVFGEGVLTDGTIKSLPSYSANELLKRDASAPDFSLLDLQGKRHTRDSYRGKWILLNFWGTWCSGCMEEIPALNDLSSNYQSQLTVVSVAVNDSPETLKEFLSQRPLSYAVLLGGTFDDPFAHSYNVHSAPTTVVIAPSGEVRFVGYGPMSLKGAVQVAASGQRSGQRRHD